MTWWGWVIVYVLGWAVCAKTTYIAILQLPSLQRVLNLSGGGEQWFLKDSWDRYTKIDLYQSIAIGSLVWPVAPLVLTAAVMIALWKGGLWFIRTPLPKPTRVSARRLQKARTAAEVAENIARLEKELELDR